MCVVSMVTDHYFPRPLPSYPSPLGPFLPAPYDPTKAIPGWTWERWHEYQELKRKAEEYDKQTKQPDCAKPDIQQIERIVEEYLERKNAKGFQAEIPGLDSPSQN